MSLLNQLVSNETIVILQNSVSSKVRDIFSYNSPVLKERVTWLLTIISQHLTETAMFERSRATVEPLVPLMFVVPQH